MTLSVIYYSADTRKNEIYMLNICSAMYLLFNHVIFQKGIRQGSAEPAVVRRTDTTLGMLRTTNQSPGRDSKKTAL